MIVKAKKTCSCPKFHGFHLYGALQLGNIVFNLCHFALRIVSNFTPNLYFLRNSHKGRVCNEKAKPFRHLAGGLGNSHLLRSIVGASEGSRKTSLTAE